MDQTILQMLEIYRSIYYVIEANDIAFTELKIKLVKQNLLDVFH